jgi:predicted NAD-dependent protein-ADP-ribosyltransferase YbiA (DUF1768 family)
MMKALEHKFGDEELKALLLSTGRMQLAVLGNGDYWGLGKDGRGKNVMGALLMSLRDKLASATA